MLLFFSACYSPRKALNIKIYDIIIYSTLEYIMRLCKICAEAKPFDPAQAKPKARGFMGMVCWDCYVRAQRLKSRGLDPKNVELDTELEALRAERRALNQQSFEARSQRILHKLSPEYIAQVQATLEGEEQAREQRHLLWVANQHAKNAERIAKQDRLQARFKSIRPIPMAKSDVD